MAADEPMKLSTAFTALNFLMALQNCLQNIKNVYNSMVTTQASVHRLATFLAAEEVPPPPPLPPGVPAGAVCLMDATLSYVSDGCADDPSCAGISESVSAATPSLDGAHASPDRTTRIESSPAREAKQADTGATAVRLLAVSPPAKCTSARHTLTRLG
jgi:hypothetical protein